MNTTLILLGGLGWVLAVRATMEVRRHIAEAEFLAARLVAERELTCSLTARIDRDASKLCWLKAELNRVRPDAAHALSEPHRN